MSHYLYECRDCRAQHSSVNVEENRIYLCPDCGSAAAGAPLKGVLEIIYDYKFLKQKLNKDQFFAANHYSPLLYPELLPLKSTKKNTTVNYDDIDPHLISLFSKKRTSLERINVNGNNLWFLDDTKNLTLSYKDRASILVVLKAKQLGIGSISAASTGNAGSSLAGICAMAGLKSTIFVPSLIPDEKRIQIQSYGASIILVKGSYDDAFDYCLDLSLKKNWYNRNTAYNPLTIEGKKSGAYEIYFSMRGKLPDCIFVPVGDGVIISGIYKGFTELKKLGWIKKIPRLIAVQASGSKALIKYLQTGKFVNKNSFSVADSIVASAPRNLFMAAEAVINSGGFGITVSDSQILRAQKVLGSSYGLLVEPAAAAAFAGYLKANIENPFRKDEIVLFLATGHGLKDVKALSQLFKKPQNKYLNHGKDASDGKPA